MRAGQLRETFAFDKRATSSDGYGNTVSTFVEQFRVRARLMNMKGGESVVASRLQGIQPSVITVRASSETREITTDWRARDAATGLVYNVRGVTVSERRDYLDILCETGVAHG